MGRDEEIGLLLRRWEQSKEGLGQVVLVSGEAGIGKSSLMASLRDHVRREQHTQIVFRCSPYYTDSPLYPVIHQLQRLLQWRRDDSVETKLASRLEQLVQTSGTPVDDLLVAQIGSGFGGSPEAIMTLK